MMRQTRTIYKNDIYVGEEKRNVPYNLINFSSHNAYEIYLLLEGARKAFIGDKVYEMVAGDAMMIRSDVQHRSEGTVPYRGICIQFTEAVLDSYFTAGVKRKLLSCFASDIISLDKYALSEVLLVFKHMLDEPENNISYLSAVLTLLRNAIREHLESAGEAQWEGHGESVTKVRIVSAENIMDYVTENSAKITGLDEVAAYFGISKKYLCTFFKKNTGMTVVTYLNDIRIQKACWLLLRTDDPVEKIGEACGFRTPEYFFRTFKKTMNYSPAQFRRNVRQFRKVSEKSSDFLAEEVVTGRNI